MIFSVVYSFGENFKGVRQKLFEISSTSSLFLVHIRKKSRIIENFDEGRIDNGN